MPTVADNIVQTLKTSGVRGVCGRGESLNGITDTLGRDSAIERAHVRHEEAAAFTAAAEAAITVSLPSPQRVADQTISTSSTAYSTPTTGGFPCWPSPPTSPKKNSGTATFKKLTPGSAS